jgi:hypothetical protein
MRNRHIIRESISLVEAAIAKSLSGSPLLPSELDEIFLKTYADLMIEHGLDSLMAEKVVTHVKSETQRLNFQSHQTWDPDSRPSRRNYSKTYPVKESRNLSSAKKGIAFHVEDIMDV